MGQSPPWYIHDIGLGEMSGRTHLVRGMVKHRNGVGRDVWLLYQNQLHRFADLSLNCALQIICRLTILVTLHEVIVFQETWRFCRFYIHVFIKLWYIVTFLFENDPMLSCLLKTSPCVFHTRSQPHRSETEQYEY